MPESTVLLVSRDHFLAQTVRPVSESIPRLRLETCGEPELARAHLRRGGVALVLAHLPSEQADKSVTGLLQTVVAERCACAVVVLVEDSDEARTTALLRAGAADCLSLPADIGRLAHLVDALTLRTRIKAPTAVPNPAEAEDLADALPLGLADLAPQVRRVAPQETTLLLTGETGTGKTHLARFIHQLSPRRDQPFQVIDCCALSPALIESALFGHVRGAFTGADRDRPGKLASVGRGTLLLDEINSLPAELQGKLLRAVDERVFEPVGSDRPQPVKARLIAASNVPLEREVATGRFRADLYYRLNVVGFYLPPLRERPEAVPPLVGKFLSEFTARNRPDVRGFSEEALRALENYNWPGNIRELRNVVERVVALSAGPEVQLRDLPETIRLHGSASIVPAMRAEPIAPATEMSAGSLNQAREAAEIQRIIQALKKHGNNRLRAAAELGISRMGLYKKLHRYGLIQSAATANGFWDKLAAAASQ
ncbi:MAG TPA: sigma-54 dependent transcriptional regulator [Gemmataceae bacterium]|nr:sigma-54 dependent transcriptional regulator [Gemmataceae bacterium]